MRLSIPERRSFLVLGEVWGNRLLALLLAPLAAKITLAVAPPGRADRPSRISGENSSGSPTPPIACRRPRNARSTIGTSFCSTPTPRRETSAPPRHRHLEFIRFSIGINRETPQGQWLARAARALSFPDLRLLAQRASAQTRRLQRRRRSPGRHQPVPTGNQCQSQALHLNRRSGRHHRKSPQRETSPGVNDELKWYSDLIAGGVIRFDIPSR